MARMLVAAQSAVLFVNGEQYVVHKDVTRVEEGHPMIARNPHLFKTLEPHYKAPKAARQESVVETARQEESAPRKRTRRAAADSADASSED